MINQSQVYDTHREELGETKLISPHHNVNVTFKTVDARDKNPPQIG